MHELSVTESLLKTASDYAIKNNAEKVICLNLQIGDLSGIIDDSVQFYWDIISEDTICSKAKLNIEKVPAKFICEACKTEFLMGQDLQPCPQCKSMDIKVIAGDEFLLKSIEIERKEEIPS
jgi:hydrogenase nickel incorporation protein HypA/HybF